MRPVFRLGSFCLGVGKVGPCEYLEYFDEANWCDLASTCECSWNNCFNFVSYEDDPTYDQDGDGYDRVCDNDCLDSMNDPASSFVHPEQIDCCSVRELDINCDGIINPGCDKDNDTYIDENMPQCPVGI